MDEMKRKSGLVFSNHTSKLSGFIDLGSCNRDIEQSVSHDNQDELATALLAEQVLVFMARAIFKPSLVMPIAHYFSVSLKGASYTSTNITKN